MIWDVAVAKSLGDARHRFRLDVAFRSRARRLVLFGASGAGKTLTLRAIAGLLAPDAGHVRLDGETLFDAGRAIDIAAERRGLGYLFQEYALFPHLNVRQNIAFGLGRGWRNPGRDAAEARVDDALQRFGLADVAARFVDELSGGQRQRTALARALVNRPRALLLDEPFAALDAPLRQRLRAELAELQAQLDIPMLLITHDPADATALADETIVVDHGRVVAAAVDAAAAEAINRA